MARTIEQHGSFVTALNCMDGRAIKPVIKWAEGKFGDDHVVDMITAPGMDLFLAKGETEGENSEMTRIKERVKKISVQKHGSRHLLVVGHCDCAGNPVSPSEHERHIKEAVQTVKSWGFPQEVAIYGILLNEKWEPTEVSV